MYSWLIAVTNYLLFMASITMKQTTICLISNILVMSHITNSPDPPKGRVLRHLYAFCVCIIESTVMYRIEIRMGTLFVSECAESLPRDKAIIWKIRFSRNTTKPWGGSQSQHLAQFWKLLSVNAAYWARKYCKSY